MSLRQPDPQYLQSPRARSNFRMAFRFALVLVGFLWVVFAIDALSGLELNRFGLRPRTIQGLAGIITAPLLHGGLGHLFNNSIPLLVALTAMFYLYPNASLRVIPMVWLGSGMMGWLIGRPSIHIGASGLLYGLLVFVFLSGVLRRDMRSVSVSMLVWFLYSAMIWGVLPVRPDMSWELHLSGAVFGVLLAWVYRRSDLVPLRRYAWEYDDTVPEWYPEAKDEKFELPASGRKDSSAH
jgi:membrane associated rhomboid family serine protease